MLRYLLFLLVVDRILLSLYNFLGLLYLQVSVIVPAIFPLIWTFCILAFSQTILNNILTNVKTNYYFSNLTSLLYTNDWAFVYVSHVRWLSHTEQLILTWVLLLKHVWFVYLPLSGFVYIIYMYCRDRKFII